MEAYYKVLGANGAAFNGGHGKWSLPHDGQPGEWMPRIEKLVPCQSGYHILTREQVVLLLGPAIHKVEWRGDIIRQFDKCVVSEARLICRFDTWNERTARLFACDCAEEAFKLIEKPDPRSVEVIRVARRYALGEASQEQLDAARAAAWAAARDAARAAVGDAAGDAARKWQTERLFEYLEGKVQMAAPEWSEAKK